ncbi:DUF4153 domain-containing protein [Mucilaginibacter sp.]
MMRLKLPSLQVLGKNIIAVIRRFPFETLFALCGTVAAWLLIDTKRVYYGPSNEGLYVRLIMMANLGLLLSLAATLYTESKGITGVSRLIIKLVAALLGLGTLWLLNPELRGFDAVRFFTLSFALHLVVAFAGYTVKGQVIEFWQFNKSIFLRFLTTVLYSGVLYAGLCAAVGSANFLFGLKIDGNIYLRLGAVIGGMFNTLFFLAGVPHPAASRREGEAGYPSALKLFTQYVLIPLAVIYVLILLSYEGKILLEWNLPKGLVSSLILGYAVFGILSILLVYPIRNHEDSKWIRAFSRSFYFLLIPLIVLLFIAVWARILPYGITPQRYFLLMLGVWLALITGYFLLSKQQSIKVIPVSLALLALLSLYGPQSALAVSVYSQSHRLIQIFKKYSALADGKFTPLMQKKASKKDGRNALDELTFLTDNAQLTALQPYFKTDLQAVNDSMYTKIDTANTYVYRKNEELSRQQLLWASKRLGLAAYDANNELQIETSYLLQTGYSEATKVSGYDYVLNAVNSSFYTEGTYTLEEKIDGITIATKENGSRLMIIVNGESAGFDMNQFAGSFLIKGKISTAQLKPDTANQQPTYSNYFARPEVLSVVKETPHYKIALSLNEFRFDQYSDHTLKATYAKGLYLIKKKD